MKNTDIPLIFGISAFSKLGRGGSSMLLKKIAEIVGRGKTQFVANLFNGFIREFQVMPCAHDQLFIYKMLGVDTQNFLDTFI